MWAGCRSGETYFGEIFCGSWEPDLSLLEEVERATEVRAAVLSPAQEPRLLFLSKH